MAGRVVTYLRRKRKARSIRVKHLLVLPCNYYGQGVEVTREFTT
jgi:hypothetical protein